MVVVEVLVVLVELVVDVLLVVLVVPPARRVATADRIDGSWA